ncbi:MAG: RAVE subunit 2/Rogdi [Benjaminiella poitrasii]|nr:MAG: RAVE subunit 2/Rogdi [Benjaminiella poitrasii]
MLYKQVNQKEWLLHDIIPPMLENLKIQLEYAFQTLRNDSIKGFITLTGSYITKAELQIKFANYHPDSPIKATITNSVPYFLEQAQQATNYISLALNRIDTFMMPSYKQATIEFLEDMYQNIEHVLHAFIYPNEASLFPYKVCHPKFFNPPLKQDLVIEFCIQDVFIVCNVFALDYNFLKHGAKAGPDNQHSFVTYKDKPVMILGEIKAQTQSPTLTDLRGSLKLILEWCQTYKQMLLQVEA